ncbi:unnamed protein product [Arabidopsis halleri]
MKSEKIVIKSEKTPHDPSPPTPLDFSIVARTDI